MATVQVEGARRLRSTLRRAGQDMRDFRAANQRVGSVVVNRARTTAPRRSGRLASTVRAGAAQGSVTIRAGRASVPYALPIHWGWPARGIAAQPWISHAAQATEGQWIDTYWRELESILNSIKGD